MSREKRRLNFFDRLMVAITFAEADDHKTALYFLNERSGQKRRIRKGRRNEKKAEDRSTLSVLRLG